MRILMITISFMGGLLNTVFSQTLDEYMQIAAENNPEVRAYFYDYLAAMEKVPQVGSLPDPELTLGIFLRPMERFMGNQRADIQLMQMFPWFGMLNSQKDEAAKMAGAKFELFQDAKNSTFYQVKTTWLEMYRLEQEIRITEKNLDILRTYERLALIRFQSGGVSATSDGSTAGAANMESPSQASSGGAMGGMGGNSPAGTTTSSGASGDPAMATAATSMGSAKSGMTEVLRLRMEVKELETNIMLLKDGRIPLQAEFNRLLNRNLGTQVDMVDSLSETTLSMERLALLDSITQNNPMLKMLAAEESAFEAQKQMARLEGRPMLGAGINYIPFSPRLEDGMEMGGDDMLMPMVTLSIPVYRKKYTSMYKEAELGQQAVQLRRENTVNQLSVQWANALRDLDNASRRSLLYKEQTDLAKQTMSLMLTTYSAGGLEYNELLAVQRQLFDYELNLINAVVDQHKAVAMLENLAATEL